MRKVAKGRKPERRELPEETRKSILVLATALAMVLVVGIWVLQLKGTFTTQSAKKPLPESTAVQQASTQLQTFWRQFDEQRIKLEQSLRSAAPAGNAHTSLNTNDAPPPAREAGADANNTNTARNTNMNTDGNENSSVTRQDQGTAVLGDEAVSPPPVP